MTTAEIKALVQATMHLKNTADRLDTIATSRSTYPTEQQWLDEMKAAMQNIWRDTHKAGAALKALVQKVEER